MTFQIKVYAFFKVENIFAMENMFKVIKILNPPRIAFFITMQIIVKLRHLFMNFHKFCCWYLNGSLAAFAAAALKCIIYLVRDRSALVVTGRLNIFKPWFVFFLFKGWFQHAQCLIHWYFLPACQKSVFNRAGFKFSLLQTTDIVKPRFTAMTMPGFFRNYCSK